MILEIVKVENGYILQTAATSQDPRTYNPKSWIAKDGYEVKEVIEQQLGKPEEKNYGTH